jgi:hypothetical protein
MGNANFIFTFFDIGWLRYSGRAKATPLEFES